MVNYVIESYRKTVTVQGDADGEYVDVDIIEQCLYQRSCYQIPQKLLSSTYDAYGPETRDVCVKRREVILVFPPPSVMASAVSTLST
jgi:hypothetical protein